MSNDILVTLGPTSLNEKTVKSCAELGVYVFRINLSHTPIDQVEETIKRIQSWTDRPVYLDSEGTQLRNGLMVSDQVEFKKGDQIRIEIESVVGDSQKLCFNPISKSPTISNFRTDLLGRVSPRSNFDSTSRAHAMASIFKRKLFV